MSQTKIWPVEQSALGPRNQIRHWNIMKEAVSQTYLRFFCRLIFSFLETLSEIYCIGRKPLGTKRMSRKQAWSFLIFKWIKRLINYLLQFRRTCLVLRWDSHSWRVVWLSCVKIGKIAFLPYSSITIWIDTLRLLVEITLEDCISPCTKYPLAFPCLE